MNGQRLLFYGSRYYPVHTTLQYQQRRLLSQTKTLLQQQGGASGKLGQPALGRPLSNKNNDSKIVKTDWARSKPTESSRNKPDFRNNNNNNNNRQRRPVPERRDWTRPADLDKKQQQSRNKPTGARGGSNMSGNNRYNNSNNNNNNNKAPAGETASQRKERKRREEEVALLIKQEEIEMQKLRSKKKKSQTEKQMRDVYIPEIINVANLSRILGIRLGESIIFIFIFGDCHKGGGKR